MLGKLSTKNYLTSNKEFPDISIREEQTVSRNSGSYGMSRVVNSLQRLFTGNVLREFDLRLAETKQEAFRNYRYTDRLFVFNGIIYTVIEDDGSDIIKAQEIRKEDNKLDTKEGKIMRSTPIHKFSICALKSDIANKNKPNIHWVENDNIGRKRI